MSVTQAHTEVESPAAPGSFLPWIPGAHEGACCLDPAAPSTMLPITVPTYEIRYSKPPHAVGFDRVVCADEFDAQILGEETYADLYEGVRELGDGDWAHVEAHDKLLLAAGGTPGWMKRIGLAVDSTIDAAMHRRR